MENVNPLCSSGSDWSLVRCSETLGDAGDRYRASVLHGYEVADSRTRLRRLLQFPFQYSIAMADLGDRIYRYFIDVCSLEEKGGGVFPPLYFRNVPARHFSHQSSGILLLVHSAAWSQRSRGCSHAIC